MYLALQVKCKQKQVCIFFSTGWPTSLLKIRTPQFYNVNMWHMPQVAYSYWWSCATRKESSLTMRFSDEFAWLIVIKEISFFYTQTVHACPKLSRVEHTDSAKLALQKVLDKYLKWCVHTKLKGSSCPGNQRDILTRHSDAFIVWHHHLSACIYRMQRYCKRSRYYGCVLSIHDLFLLEPNHLNRVMCSLSFSLSLSLWLVLLPPLFNDVSLIRVPFNPKLLKSVEGPGMISVGFG